MSGTVDRNGFRIVEAVGNGDTAQTLPFGQMAARWSDVVPATWPPSLIDAGRIGRARTRYFPKKHALPSLTPSASQAGGMRIIQATKVLSLMALNLYDGCNGKRDYSHKVMASTTTLRFCGNTMLLTVFALLMANE